MCWDYLCYWKSKINEWDLKSVYSLQLQAYTEMENAPSTFKTRNATLWFKLKKIGLAWLDLAWKRLIIWCWKLSLFSCLYLHPSPKFGAEVLRFPATRNGRNWRPLPNITPLLGRPVVDDVACLDAIFPAELSDLCLGIVPNCSILRRAFGGGVCKYE